MRENQAGRDGTGAPAEIEREAYQAPELKDLGCVADLTKSVGGSSGSDSGYS